MVFAKSSKKPAVMTQSSETGTRTELAARAKDEENAENEDPGTKKLSSKQLEEMRKEQLRLDKENCLKNLENLLRDTCKFTSYLVDRISAQQKAFSESTVQSPKAATNRESPRLKNHKESPRLNNHKESPKAKQRQPLLLTGGNMRDYQLEGYEWLKVLFTNSMNGILADEMGLGKTIQSIAMIAYLIEEQSMGPFLVVCPLTTLDNWQAEFRRFAPKIETYVYHGTNRKTVLRHFATAKKVPGTSFKTKPVLITNYESLKRDVHTLKKYLWAYVIVDEAQCIKNAKAELSLALKQFLSLGKLLLTGTPLQNNVTELWALLHFILPQIFHDYCAFESWFEMTNVTGKDAEDAEEQEHEQCTKVVSLCHQVIAPFILRRTKADVELTIPHKKEVVVYTPLSTLQQDYYKLIVDRMFHQSFKKEEVDETPVEVDARGRPVRSCKKRKIPYFSSSQEESFSEHCWTPSPTRKRPLSEIQASTPLMSQVALSAKKSIDSESNTSLVRDMDLDYESESSSDCSKAETTAIKLENSNNDEAKLPLTLAVSHKNYFMLLRKLVHHPYLLAYSPDIRTNYYPSDESFILASGKLRVFDRLCSALLKRGHRCLIFSQFVSVLDVLEHYMEIRGYSFLRLDGQYEYTLRQQSIDQFNTDHSIGFFLISTRAGGLGINLATADTVIIYDSDWNPQRDLQAQDRCHRFGQTKPVVVYRLLAKNTVDQRMFDRATSKRKLEKLIIGSGSFSKIEKKANLTTEALMAILNGEADFSVVQKNEEVLTDEELEKLLDRSDLVRQ